MVSRIAGSLFLAIGFALALPAQTLRLVQTISLPGVKGRIDHLCFDSSDNRLFVAALGNNTVEVVDLKVGKVERSLGGFSKPQGLLYLREFNRIFVADGDGGALHVLDGQTFSPVATISFGDDADNVRYDAAAKQIFVGYGSGALGIVDPAKHTVIGTISLSNHPESFQIDATSNRVFINVPRSHAVLVADRRTRTVVASWELGSVGSNYSMALDEANHRAFVACRAPARLLVLDTDSGRRVAQLDLHGDCDDIFYDANRKQLYASCGEGFIDLISQADGDRYALKEAVQTKAKARTSSFDGNRLFVAVPQRAGADAQIQIYELAK